ncbi:MAG: tyrosine-type recombinase/integrase [Proteobacteria bacterium]|nr:tyrosine-type recombinase/integrase [Pseudomonadota bacterium]
MKSQAATILPFHRPRRERPRRPSYDGPRYFTEKQVKLIRRTARDAAKLGKVKDARNWMLIDLLTSSGLREAEAADVRVGDLKLGYDEASIFVRNGKGGRSRMVQIPASLKTHLKSFQRWKTERGEPMSEDDPLFFGQRGQWTAAAVSQAVRRVLESCGLYERGRCVHALRHSYAVALYRRERDLRCVQKQLGHASIQTTQIYADCLPEDIREQVRGLWGGTS